MVVKPFVYIAAAVLTGGLIVAVGHVLGNVAARPGAAVPVAGAAAPAVSARPTATPAPAAIQAIGVQPVRIDAGTGPYGSVAGTGNNTVALTFDDGPDPSWTPKVLALLRDAGVKATFCLIGQNVASFPDLVRAIVADGHTLCNHTWNHNLSIGQLAKASIRADLQRTSAAIAAAAPGARIDYFRAPGGNFTASLVAVSRELGMTPLSWTVDPRDWSRPSVASIVSSITTSCRTGAIFLLHDGGGDRSHTVEAVRRFLPVLSRNHAFAALPTGGT